MPEISKRLIQKEPYPKNILMEMEFEDEQIKDILSDPIKIASLEYVISKNLNERDAKILRYYYKEKKSSKEIGSLEEIGGISPSRVSELLNHDIRRCRRPENKKIILLGIDKYYEEKEQKLVEHYEILLREKAKSIDKIDMESVQTIAKGYKLADHINTLNLSTQAHNCLARGGIYYVYDLYLTDKKRLSKIRNVGKKVMLEICETINRVCGFEILDDASMQSMELKKRKDVCLSMNFINSIDAESKYCVDSNYSVRVVRESPLLTLRHICDYKSETGDEYMVYKVSGLRINRLNDTFFVIKNFVEVSGNVRVNLEIFRWTLTNEIRQKIDEDASVASYEVGMWKKQKYSTLPEFMDILINTFNIDSSRIEIVGTVNNVDEND